MSRRNKLLGLWAAAQMGKSGDAAQAYAKEVIVADMEEPGDEDVFRKLRSELGESVSDALIREKMTECLNSALAEAAKP